MKLINREPLVLRDHRASVYRLSEPLMTRNTDVPSPSSYLPDTAHLVALLTRCWSGRTSSLWSPEKPSRGQCGVTALVLQDHFGGDILKTLVGPSWHFYNRIGGRRIDVTADQFPYAIDYLDVLSTREEAFADSSQAQYEELSRQFEAALSSDSDHPSWKERAAFR